MGRKITIRYGNCIFKYFKGIEITQCILEANIYKLGVTNKQKCNETIIPLIMDMNKINSWHLKLGHINQIRLKKILNVSKGVESFDENNIFQCPSYLKRKQHRIKFPQKNITKAKKIRNHSW
jgi:hypothetical protein